MANLFNYVEKYGDITFKEKEFNAIDNIVFSELSYLEFSSTKINDGKYSIKEIGKEYLSKNKYKDIKRLGLPQKEAYKILEIIVKKKRYKDILLFNYVYKVDKEKQFSAMTFKINNKLNYICFEGTNQHVIGWKEDGEMACMFPVPSHVEAIKYVNDNVKLFGPNIIIGGHSKGGNMALVSGMYMKKYKKHKVVKIYSNDGPGLRKKEFESKEYNNIKKKYIHIVPDCSMVGILLRNDIYNVVKSSKKNIIGHSMTTWLIDDEKFIESKLSEKSKRLEKSIIEWLDNHNDKQRIKVVNTLFKVLEEVEITNINDIIKLKNLIKIIRSLKNIDKESKDLIIDFIVYNIKNTRGK